MKTTEQIEEMARLKFPIRNPGFNSPKLERQSIFIEVYTQAQKDLLSEVSEGFDEFFESTDRELADSWTEKNISEKAWQASRLPLMKKIEELEKDLKDMDGIYLGLGDALEKRREENEELREAILKYDSTLVRYLDAEDIGAKRTCDKVTIEVVEEIRTKFNLDKNDKGAV